MDCVTLLFIYTAAVQIWFQEKAITATVEHPKSILTVTNARI